MKILVVNAGSSSIKYQLYNMDDASVLAKGLCERIGVDGKIKHTTTGQDKWECEIPMPTHKEAIEAVIAALTDADHGCLTSITEIDAIGHRIVQGGPYFSASVLVDDTVIEDLEKCIDLAPVHTQPHLYGIGGCRAALPDVPQVLVFDTAFHQTMPEEAYTYALPYELCQKVETPALPARISRITLWRLFGSSDKNKAPRHGLVPVPWSFLLIGNYLLNSA